MATTNGIATHLLQFRQLTVQRIFVQSSTQAAQIMVQANSVQLHVLPIQPKSRLRIKAEATETRYGFDLVDDFSFDQ